VTVIDDFVTKLRRVKPYLIPKEDKPVAEGEFRQSPAELKTYKQYTLCINCMLCYAACPEYGLTTGFIGPAAISLAHRYNQDSASRSSPPTKASGNVLSSAPVLRSVPSMWILPVHCSRSRSKAQSTGTGNT